MSADAATDQHVSGITLTYVLFGGILVWMVHLIGIAWMTGRACATGQHWPAHVITAATFVVTLHVLWVSFRVARAGGASSGLAAVRRLGWLAIVLNVFNLILIVAEWSPVLVLDPCAVG